MVINMTKALISEEWQKEGDMKRKGLLGVNDSINEFIEDGVKKIQGLTIEAYRRMGYDKTADNLEALRDKTKRERPQNIEQRKINGVDVFFDSDKFPKVAVPGDYDFEIRMRHIEKMPLQKQIKIISQDHMVALEAQKDSINSNAAWFEAQEALKSRSELLESRLQNACKEINTPTIVDILGCSEGHIRKKAIDHFYNPSSPDIINASPRPIIESIVHGLPIARSRDALDKSSIISKEEYLKEYSEMYYIPLGIKQDHDYESALRIHSEDGKKVNGYVDIKIIVDDNGSEKIVVPKRGEIPGLLPGKNGSLTDEKPLMLTVVNQDTNTEREVFICKNNQTGDRELTFSAVTQNPETKKLETIASASFAAASEKYPKGFVVVNEVEQYENQGVGIALLGALLAEYRKHSRSHPPIFSHNPEIAKGYYDMMIKGYEKTIEIYEKFREKTHDRKITWDSIGDYMDQFKSKKEISEGEKAAPKKHSAMPFDWDKNAKNMVYGFEGEVLVYDERALKNDTLLSNEIRVIPFDLQPDKFFTQRYRNTTDRRINELLEQKNDLQHIKSYCPGAIKVASGKGNIDKVLENRINRIDEKLQEMVRDQIYGFSDGDIVRAYNRAAQKEIPISPHVAVLDIPQAAEVKIADTPLENISISDSNKIIDTTLGISAGMCDEKIGVYTSPKGGRYMVLTNSDENVIKMVNLKNRETAAVIFEHKSEFKKEAEPAFRIAVAPDYRGELLSIKCIDEYLKRNPTIPERFVAANEHDLPSLQEYSKDIETYKMKWEKAHESIENHISANPEKQLAGFLGDNVIVADIKDGVAKNITPPTRSNKNDKDDRDI